MRRVCSVCKKLIGCYFEDTVATARSCDSCDETDCPFTERVGLVESAKTSHGICEACYRSRAAFSFFPP